MIASLPELVEALKTLGWIDEAQVEAFIMGGARRTTISSTSSMPCACSLRTSSLTAASSKAPSPALPPVLATQCGLHQPVVHDSFPWTAAVSYHQLRISPATSEIEQRERNLARLPLWRFHSFFKDTALKNCQNAGCHSYVPIFLSRAETFIRDTGGADDDVMVFISCGHEHDYMSRHGRKVPVSFYHRFTRDACAFADKFARGRLVRVLRACI